MTQFWHWLTRHKPSSIGLPFCDCEYGDIQFEFLKGQKKR